MKNNMIKKINEHRVSIGKKSLIVNRHQNTLCAKHCVEMFKKGEIYHSPIEDWEEIVVSCPALDDIKDVELCLFNLIKESEGHRQIIEECDVVGSEMVIYNGIVYFTLRGKKCR